MPATQAAHDVVAADAHRVELAKRSLEWHEANSSAGQPEDLSSAAEQPPASG